MQTTKRDRLGRVRRPEQDETTFQRLRPGRESKSHNVNMSARAHAAFSRLTPAERGDLIEKALRE